MIARDARPRLAKGVRLREDPVRGGFNLLAPERVLRANASSVAVIALCDGAHTIGEIVDALCGQYRADRERIERDTFALLDALVEKRMITP